MEVSGLLAGPGVPSRGRSGTAHLMVGSPAGVEVVARKVHRIIFRQRQGVMTFEAFCDECGIAEKRLKH